MWTVNGYITVILKEISPEYSLEGLMLKLKLQYFGHLMGKTDSLEKTLMPGKSEGRRRWGRQRRGGWMASPIQWPWVWASSGSWWWTGKPGVLQSMGLQRVGHSWATELNWRLLSLSNLVYSHLIYQLRKAITVTNKITSRCVNKTNLLVSTITVKIWDLDKKFKLAFLNNWASFPQDGFAYTGWPL